MFEIEKLPSYVLEIARSKGVDIDNIYLTAYCDMDKEHVFCDTYLIATDKSLYALSGSTGLVSKENRATGGLDNIFYERDFYIL